MLEFSNLPVSERIGFVIDVKGVKVNGDSVQIVDVGWAFFPIQVTLQNEDMTFSNYVNTGLYSVPLWQGAVKQDLINYATRTDNPYNLLRKEKSLKKLDNASVILRLHDKQRETFPVTGDYRNLNNSYLPQNNLAKQAFSLDKLRMSDSLARVGAAPSMTLGEMKSKIVHALSKRYNLD
jgi:hypothetical protein